MERRLVVMIQEGNDIVMDSSRLILDPDAMSTKYAELVAQLNNDAPAR